MISMKWVRAGVLGLALGFAAVGVPAYAGPDGGTTGTEPTASQRIVARTVRAMADASRRGCGGIRENTGRSIRGIARADHNNATDAQITTIGANSKQRNTDRAAAAAARIEEIKTRALAALASHEGTEAQTARINEASGRATAHVNECRDTANGRIDADVTRATAAGGGGG